MASWRYEAEGAERALIRATVASVLISVTIYGLVIPAVGPLFPSAALARVVRNSGCGERLVAAAGYQEPSVVFLIGTETQMTDGSGAAEFLRHGPCRFALVEAQQDRAFTQRAETIGVRYAHVGRIEGINMNGGRAIAITIYRAEGQG